MPRPRKCRRVEQSPKADYFKPRGVPLLDLIEVYLDIEGLEALRLADLEGLTAEKAAERMGVSRHIFGRVLAQARSIVAEALVEGRALRIEGGRHELGKIIQHPTPKELGMTKIAVTSEGPNLDDQVDPRFGRAGGFVVVDLETGETNYVDNGASQAMAHGAGIQAAERIAGAGAEIVLTGFVGPKAFTALAAAGVKVGQEVDGMSVGEAVEAFKAGRVKIADKPNK